MRSTLSHRVFGWRAALLLAAGVCASPGTAAADCGDYVVIRGADGRPLPHAGHTAPLSDPAPCHGPNCSGSPTRDPLAPAAPPATGGAKECVALGAGDAPAAGAARFPIPTSDPCPPGTAASIFHPPRVG